MLRIPQRGLGFALCDACMETPIPPDSHPQEVVCPTS